MKFKLPRLPYDIEALAPHISAQTLEIHHGKHHAGYVRKLNELVGGNPQAERSLEEIIQRAGPGALFNNAAQHWNHSFYWKCMSPRGGKLSATLDAMLRREFGSLDDFRRRFSRAAIEQFGSGCAWLVMTREGIRITTTADADLPLAHGDVALLARDVWEHAYYLDYRNERGKYLEGFWKVINWDFVNSNLDRAAAELRHADGAANRVEP